MAHVHWLLNLPRIRNSKVPAWRLCKRIAIYTALYATMAFCATILTHVDAAMRTRTTWIKLDGRPENPSEFLIEPEKYIGTSTNQHNILWHMDREKKYLQFLARYVPLQSLTRYYPRSSGATNDILLGAAYVAALVFIFCAVALAFTLEYEQRSTSQVMRAGAVQLASTLMLIEWWDVYGFNGWFFGSVPWGYWVGSLTGVACDHGQLWWLDWATGEDGEGARGVVIGEKGAPVAWKPDRKVQGKDVEAGFKIF